MFRICEAWTFHNANVKTEDHYNSYFVINKINENPG